MMILLLTFGLSFLFCALYRWLALRRQWLDRPNERSSHGRATPHGGGLPLLLAYAVGCLVAGVLAAPTLAPLIALAGLLLLCGVADDQVGLPVSLRLAVYALCSLAAALVMLHPWLPDMNLGMAALLLAGTMLGLLWLLNLYNFMDGIDGFAALQCLLACAVAALLALRAGGVTEYALACALLAAAQLGFLCWNWPPARLFMGDAGSIPTGFLLGCLAVTGQVEGLVPLQVWLILLAVFVTDASWTVTARLLRGETITRPHREHAYQRLARHWQGHRPVTLLLAALVMLWLVPLALAAVIYPALATSLVILAYIPLLAGMARLRVMT